MIEILLQRAKKGNKASLVSHAYKSHTVGVDVSTRAEKKKLPTEHVDTLLGLLILLGLLNVHGDGFVSGRLGGRLRV